MSQATVVHRGARRQQRPARTSWRFAPLAIILAGTIVRLPQLGHSLYEMHSFRQTQTALLARGYADTSLNPMHSPLALFGAGSDVPMEFPLAQLAGALLIRTGIDSDLAMRLVGLVGFVSTAILLAVLARRWHGPRVAVVAVLVLEFSPFGLAWGAASLIEFVAVALALAVVLVVDTWFVGGPRILLLLAALLSMLAFAVKSTTAPLWCLLIGAAGLAFLARTGWRAGAGRVVAGWAAVAVPGLVAAYAWTTYSDGIKQAAPLTQFLTSGALEEWNFGTLQQRTDPATWWVIAERIPEITGTLGLLVVAVALIGLVTGPTAGRWTTLGWLATAVAGPVIFFNLYVVHNYYLCAVAPALAVLVGLGADRILTEVAERFPTSESGATTARLVATIAAGAVVTVLVASSFRAEGAASDVSQWRHDGTVPTLPTSMAQIIPADTTIVMIGCDWDPTLAYYSGRTALMFRTPEVAQAFWASSPGGRQADAAEYPLLLECTTTKDRKAYLPDGVRATYTGVGGFYYLKIGRRYTD